MFGVEFPFCIKISKTLNVTSDGNNYDNICEQMHVFPEIKILVDPKKKYNNQAYNMFSTNFKAF